ncbi:hypothetical protein CVT25_008903, partial [Psilocybe cyanescens]
LTYALIITVQPQTLVGTPTLVAWNVEPSDTDVQIPAGSDLIFDLRFVQDVGDVGLAIANVQPAEGEDAGTSLVTFPLAGTYTLKAVSGSPEEPAEYSHWLKQGSSRCPVEFHNERFQYCTASIMDPTPTPSSTSGSASSTTSQGDQTPTSSPSPQAKLASSSKNIPAIVGGTIGGLLLLALLAVVFVFVARRRRRRMEMEARRRTFHRDMMVQRRGGGGGGGGGVGVLEGGGEGMPAPAPLHGPMTEGGGGGERTAMGGAETTTTAARASDLPSVLPALSFWSWPGSGSSGSGSRTRDDTDLESQGQARGGVYGKDADVERGLGSGYVTGLVGGLGLASGGGQQLDRSISASASGRAPPLGTGHIVPSPKGPRGPVSANAKPTVVGEQEQDRQLRLHPASANTPLSPPPPPPPPPPAATLAAGVPQSPMPSTPPAKSPYTYGVPLSRTQSSKPTQITTQTSTTTTVLALPLPSGRPSGSSNTAPAPAPALAPLRTRRQAEIAARIAMLSAQMVDVVRAQRDAREGRPSANRWSMREDGSVVLSPVSPPVSGSGSGSSFAVRSPVSPSPATGVRTSTATAMTAGTMSTVRQYEAVLEEMQREMVWLRDQEYSAWAMGLTDVLPPGHARYMTP